MSDISGVIPARDTAEPRVSVIMPVYNAAPYLAKAVESILAQSFGDFEFLIHDDGSADGSLKILHDYAAKDSRVIVTTGTNEGIVATLNRLIGTARAPLLARMDGDDIALPERLEIQVARMETEPEIVALGSQVEIIDEAGRLIRRTHQPTDHETMIERHVKTVQPQLYHPSTLLRSEAFHAVGGYRKDFNKVEDFDLWLRLEERGRLANCQEVLLKYRVHSSSVSHSNSAMQRGLAWKAAKEAADRRGQEFSRRYPATTKNFSERPADLYRKWGWWALAEHNLSTARVYAAKAILREPLRRESWILGACVLRGS